jgi:hypothetical protein
VAGGARGAFGVASGTEFELLRSALSRTVSYRQLVAKEVSAREVGNLIALLKGQKRILEEDQAQTSDKRTAMKIYQNPASIPVLLSNGAPVYGQVPRKCLELAASIRSHEIYLTRGHQGVQSGWGEQHIEAAPGRMKIIQNAGFRTVGEYVQFVLDQIEEVGLSADGKLLLTRQQKRQTHWVVAQFEPALGHYTVTTAIPKRNGLSAKDSVIWRR